MLKTLIQNRIFLRFKTLNKLVYIKKSRLFNSEEHDRTISEGVWFLQFCHMVQWRMISVSVRTSVFHWLLTGFCHWNVAFQMGRLDLAIIFFKSDWPSFNSNIYILYLWLFRIFNIHSQSATVLTTNRHYWLFCSWLCLFFCNFDFVSRELMVVNKSPVAARLVVLIQVCRYETCNWL